MCGRFALTSRAALLEKLFGASCPEDLAPRYNIAPTQPVLACCIRHHLRTFGFFTWGLLPHWAHDPARVQRPINARAETVTEKPTFRDAFRARRALVPADLFYEWRHHGKRVEPYAFRRRDGLPFALAAVWDRWQRPGVAPVESLSLIVCSPNSLVSAVHNRMPVIIEERAMAVWLDPATPVPHLLALMQPSPSEIMECFLVSPLVNDPRHDGPALIVPLSS